MSSLEKEQPALFSGQEETPALEREPDHTRPPRQDRRPLTQRDRMLAMLLDAEEVCGSTFYEAYLSRFSVQIHRLRSEGFVIVKRRCDLARHEHEGTGWLYRLEAVPVEPGSRR